MDEPRWMTARMRTLSTLSRDTVHELRGAASGLTLHVELLARELAQSPSPARERQQRTIDDIRGASQRLLAIAETFVRHATVDPTPGPVDVAEIARALVSLCRPYAARRHVAVELASLSPAPLVAYASRDLVLQGVLELMIDVLDCRTGERAVVDVAVEHVAGCVRLALRVPADTGPLDVAARAASPTLSAGGATLAVSDGEIVIDLPARPRTGGPS